MTPILVTILRRRRGAEPPPLPVPFASWASAPDPDPADPFGADADLTTVVS